MYNIKTYQKKLKSLGYEVDVDGVYGPQTKRAIVEFQNKNNLKPDGTMGPKTWGSLFSTDKRGKVETHKVVETPWMDELLSIKGWHEVKDKKRLYAWLRSDGTTLGDPSKLPWCGDAVETAIKLTLPNEPFEGPVKENPYWAQNWVHFGIPLDKPIYGAILVFKRPSGGHVGFYVGEDKTHYHVLGGNQSNSITVSRIAKNRLVKNGIRYPKTATLHNKTPQNKFGNLKTTTNEQ